MNVCLIATERAVAHIGWPVAVVDTAAYTTTFESAAMSGVAADSAVSHRQCARVPYTAAKASLTWLGETGDVTTDRAVGDCHRTEATNAPAVDSR